MPMQRYNAFGLRNDCAVMNHKYQDNHTKPHGLLDCALPVITASIPILLFLCSAVLHASDSIDKSDCLVIVPDLDDAALLTREERIQMMDGMLKEALSRAQDCRQKDSDTEKKSNDSASARNPSDSGAANASTGGEDDAGNGANAAGADEQNDSEAKQNNAQNSRTAMPADELSGTETAEHENEGAIKAEGFSGTDKQSKPQSRQAAVPSGELSGTELPKQEIQGKISKSAEDQSSISAAAENGVEPLNNGKLPEDIPSADNDDIIARQIREAALAESDTQKQAKLWNEYRRYKGISVK